MILMFSTMDGSQQPALNEFVQVEDDGRIHGWRTVSDNGVGRFDGLLPDDTVGELRELVTRAGAAPGPVPPPGSSSETLELGGGGAVSVAGLGNSTEPWPALADAARNLLSVLTEYPVQVVVIERVGTNGAGLAHRGSEPLRLDLSHLRVDTVAWRGYYEPAGQWSTELAGPPDLELRPGKRFDFELGPEPTDDDITVHVGAEFVIVSPDSRIEVRAGFAPEIQPPRDS